MDRYILNCDADEILYTAAFSVETTAYKLTVKGSDKVYDFGTKYTRKEIEHYYGLQGKVKKLDYELTTYKVPKGPKGFALKCCKNILEMLGNIGDVKLWMTADDKSNFRFSVAKTEGPYGMGYKAGRAPRPLYYNDVREYLLSRGATEVTGYEADDALGISQCDNSVAVHQDKDINRISGRHYNWRTGERYIVEQPGKLWLDDKRKLRGNGNAFFFAQMLSGDRTDNIPSLGRFGDVEIYNTLKDCKEEKQYYHIIEECFFNHYGQDYIQIMYEMADLLFIMGPEKIIGREYLRRLL